MSGGEAAAFGALGPGGLVMVRVSLSRAKVKEGLAVAAAEQEDEPLQVAAQLGQAVGGVADELCQGAAPCGRGRGPAIG